MRKVRIIDKLTDSFGIVIREFSLKSVEIDDSKDSRAVGNQPALKAAGPNSINGITNCSISWQRFTSGPHDPNYLTLSTSTRFSSGQMDSVLHSKSFVDGGSLKPRRYKEAD